MTRTRCEQLSNSKCNGEYGEFGGGVGTPNVDSEVENRLSVTGTISLILKYCHVTIYVII